jgi:hypothetical protein
VARDPRTLREIARVARCHLLPEWAGLSNETVNLDADFDSRIGAKCDEELRKYVQTFFGDRIGGKLALIGGSDSLSSILVPSKGVFAIPKPKRGTVDAWQTRALGTQDGKVSFGGFVGETVDMACAFLSLVHSAMLVLHYHADERVFGPPFDQARTLLSKALSDQLTREDYDLILGMTSIAVRLDVDKAAGSHITVHDWRNLYDPSLDFGDGLIEGFPGRCIFETEGQIVIRLPYSQSLRGSARFPLS